MVADEIKHSISEQRLEANRANALKSTGPKTEQGKSRTRLNATRHGLTGQVSIMTDDDRLAHGAFCVPLIKSLAPEGPLEVQYAQLIAQDHWRLNRIVAIEEGMLSLGQFSRDTAVEDSCNDQTDNALTQARVFHRDAKQIQLLTTYEGRITRNIRKNMEQLQELQAKRIAAFREALAEAELLAALIVSEGKVFDPQEHGFVFSAVTFNKIIDRKRLIRRARLLEMAA